MYMYLSRSHLETSASSGNLPPGAQQDASPRHALPKCPSNPAAALHGLRAPQADCLPRNCSVVFSGKIETFGEQDADLLLTSLAD